MNMSKNGLPPSVHIFPKLKPPHRSLLFHQISVLLITFIAYASFHASRKPSSIVKSVLGPPPPDTNTAGWPPFNSPSSGTHRLGELDLAFLSSYAFAMFFSGHFADTLPLRFFLLFGMIGSGFLTILFGLGYWFHVHRFAFFVIVQLLSGLFQSIGWPCVVSIVANWFGKSKRGLIMGLWNSHTSVGNIIGSLLASSALEFGWGWSFLLPGAFIIFVSLFVFFFLIVSPLDLGFQSKDDINVMMEQLHSVPVDVAMAIPLQLQLDSEEATLLEDQTTSDHDHDHDHDQTTAAAIGFFEAWRLPGVAPFAFSLFFSKLVAYTFLYWLPFYIRHTAVAGVHLSHKTAGILSTIFDIGGVFGGVLAGYISDLIEARAVTSIVFLFLSIPALVLYRVYGSITMYINILLMFLSGLLVNGPYSLITTAVAADLGTQSCIKGNSRALATVTAIIDGTGSVGAALGPLLAGYISTRGWNSVFSMLILSIFLAGLFLIRIAKSEIKNIIGEEKWFRYTIPTS